MVTSVIPLSRGYVTTRVLLKLKRRRLMEPTHEATTEGGKTETLVLHGITITHSDRVISEIGHVTKGELAEYHAAAGPWMLPQIVRHPLSLLRCPSGVDKQCFFQRSPGRGLGADVHTFEFRNKGKLYEYLYIEDEKGLLDL